MITHGHPSVQITNLVAGSCTGSAYGTSDGVPFQLWLGAAAVAAAAAGWAGRATETVPAEAGDASIAGRRMAAAAATNVAGGFRRLVRLC